MCFWWSFFKEIFVGEILCWSWWGWGVIIIVEFVEVGDLVEFDLWLDSGLLRLVIKCKVVFGFVLMFVKYIMDVDVVREVFFVWIGNLIVGNMWDGKVRV